MEETKKETLLNCVPNGPIILEGNFQIKDVGGKIIETAEKVYLCRCGGSSKKPFCDGTHKKINFEG